MKKLIIQFILPVTIISFAVITKWWYTIIVDAPKTFLYGFPFPYVCEGWHTSLSLQIFVLELIADLLFYFIFWFIIITVIDRFWIKIQPHKIVKIGLWIISGFIFLISMLIASNPDNIYYLKIPFGIQVLETGVYFIWQ